MLAGDGLAPAPGLTGAARVTHGLLDEQAGFLAGRGGRLFTTLHRPATGTADAAVVVCGAMFTEQHTDYRRELRFARFLAAEGIAVARFHPRGFGNSDPADGDLPAFAVDAEDVAAFARHAVGCARVGFLGAGLGAFAATAAAVAGETGGPLVLWKPVVSGRRFVRDLLRARMVALTRVGVTAVAGTDALRARLEAGEDVDVMGFTVTSRLYRSLAEADLATREPGSGRTLLQPFRGDRAREADRVVEAWRTAGASVDVAAIEIAEDPWFIPDGDVVAGTVDGRERELMAEAHRWLRDAWERPA